MHSMNISGNRAQCVDSIEEGRRLGGRVGKKSVQRLLEVKRRKLGAEMHQCRAFQQTMEFRVHTAQVASLTNAGGKWETLVPSEVDPDGKIACA